MMMLTGRHRKTNLAGPLRSVLAWTAIALLALVARASPAHESHGLADAPAAKRSQAARVELGAAAAVSASGRIFAVAKAGGHVVWRASDDGGRNWSPARNVNAGAEPVAADGDSRPKIALGPADEIYVSWTRPLAKPYTGEIRFARSLDGGSSFDPPRTVHVDRQQITHRFDALTVTPAGKVVLAWIDKRDQQAAQAAARDYRGAAVYFAVSTDRGASFRPEARLADHSCECCRIALLAAADGSVLAFWRHVFAPNVRDHALARIGADDSVGPTRRATFNDWRIDACPHHGPALAADGTGQLHGVWFTQGTPAGVRYGRLRRDGVEAVDGERQVGGARAAHADIAAHGNRIVIVWKEFDGQLTQLLAERSEDSGISWQPLTLAATAGASGQPHLLARGEDFSVFWNTADEGFRVLPVGAGVAR